MGMIDRFRKRVELHASYIRVFETPDGKEILRHLMKTGFVYESTFVAGDPQQTTLNEGSRRMVLSILKFANQDHNKLINQLEEGLKDENT